MEKNSVKRPTPAENRRAGQGSVDPGAGGILTSCTRRALLLTRAALFLTWTALHLAWTAFLLLALPALLLLACAHDAAPGKPASRGEVAPVLVAQATLQDVPIRIQTIGTVEAYRSVAVRARVGGTVTRVQFREGQEVTAGTPLLSIDPRPYELALQGAEADLAQEKAKAMIADLDARRAARLAQQSLVSQQDFERVLATAQAESASVRSLAATADNARLNLEFCRIVAPISGRTSNLLVQEGNLVSANDARALVVINQISPIFVSFSVPQRQFPEVVRCMAQGELAVEAAVVGAAGEPAQGRLTFVNNTVDPTTGGILLKAEFPNEDRKLWPGENVRASLTLTTRKGALVVPAPAVQSGQKGDYVLVVKQDQTTEMRPVTVGPRVDAWAIIEAGLEPGETVITDGHLRVVPGAKVTVKRDLESAGNPSAPGPAGRPHESPR